MGKCDHRVGIPAGPSMQFTEGQGGERCVGFVSRIKRQGRYRSQSFDISLRNGDSGSRFRGWVWIGKPGAGFEVPDEVHGDAPQGLESIGGRFENTSACANTVYIHIAQDNEIVSFADDKEIVIPIEGFFLA